MWEKSRSSPNKNSDRCSSWHTRLNRHTRTSNACFFKHTEGSSRTYPDKYSTSPSFSRGCFHSIAQDYTGLRPRHPFLDSLFGFVFTHYDWNTFYEVRRISYRRTVFLKVCLSVFVCVLSVHTDVSPCTTSLIHKDRKIAYTSGVYKLIPYVCMFESTNVHWNSMKWLCEWNSGEGQTSNVTLRHNAKVRTVRTGRGTRISVLAMRN